MSPREFSLGLSSENVSFLDHYNELLNVVIRLDYLDEDCVLRRNVCVRGISLKEWAEATIYVGDEILDRVKSVGLVLLNWPQIEAESTVKVVTKPETEWAIIVAVEVSRLGESKGFYESLKGLYTEE